MCLQFEDTGRSTFARKCRHQNFRSIVPELKRSEQTSRVQNPMLYCKITALITFVFLVSMISTLRYAKRVPTFSS
jgi:hypothetical protein